MSSLYPKRWMMKDEKLTMSQRKSATQKNHLFRTLCSNDSFRSTASDLGSHLAGEDKSSCTKE